jgi:hypothetical protein
MSSADQTFRRWLMACDPGNGDPPRYLKRTVTMALCVGTVFFATNQLAAILT